MVLMSMGLMAQESLQNELDAHYRLFLEEASPKAITEVEQDLQQRKALHMKKKIPRLGDKAIDFTLKNIRGETFTLYEALKESPLVLFWYRGGWCPYCNMQLAYYQAYDEEIKKMGAKMVGIAPENPQMGKETEEDNEIGFELLSDTNNTIARQYNIVYTVKPTLYEMMDKRFDLYDYYEKNNRELPLTVLYVIDQQGFIQYAFIDEDFTKRAEPQQFLEVLKSLKKK